MTFSNDNTTIGGEPGQMMYDAIVSAAKRGVTVRIAKVRRCRRHHTPPHRRWKPRGTGLLTRGTTAPPTLQSVSGIFGDDDVEKLAKLGYAIPAYVNYTHLIGAGILHTKFVIADNTSAWV